MPPRRFERRSPFGDVLLARCLAGGDEAVSFDDLAAAVAGRGARVSDVAAWVAGAQAGGILEDAGFALDADGRPVGPRRFRVAPGRTFRGRDA